MEGYRTEVQEVHIYRIQCCRCIEEAAHMQPEVTDIPGPLLPTLIYSGNIYHNVKTLNDTYSRYAI